MYTPLVSIVIPIYNSEKFLSRTLNSVVQQTYNNLEIILINDGSLDNSLNICEKFSEKDTRISLYNNSNYGPSYSRNFGINKANGKYIIFIDSDDYVDLDYVEKMVNKAEKDQVDLVICNIMLEFYYKENVTKCKKNLNINTKILTYEYYKDLLQIYDLTIGPVVKLLRLDILKKYNIKFPEDISFSEDRMLMVQYSEYIRSYAYIDDPMYHYCFYDNFSLSKSRSLKSFNDAIYVLEQEIQYLKNTDTKTLNRITTYNILTYSKMFIHCNDISDNLYEYNKRINSMMNLIKKNNIKLESNNKLCLIFLNNNLYFGLYLYYKFRNLIKRIVFNLRKIL